MSHAGPSASLRKDSDLIQVQHDLHELVKSLARISARASRKLGFKFDMSDPQTVRDLITITLDEVARTPCPSPKVKNQNTPHYLSVSSATPPANAQEIVARQRGKVMQKGNRTYLKSASEEGWIPFFPQKSVAFLERVKGIEPSS